MPLSAADLRARRALAKAVGKRLSRRAIPRQRPPTKGQLVYQRYLTRIRKTLERLLKEVLIPELPSLLEQAGFERDGLRKDAVTDEILRVFSNLAVQFGTFHPDEEIEEQAAQVATEVDEHQAAEHQRQVKAALGVEVLRPEPWKQSILRQFISDNQGLVKSLVGAELDTFKTITSSGIRGGIRVEDIAKQLRERLNITKSKAALLARDQTLKLFGEETEMRQRDLGVEEYDWDTSKDERVRPMHQALDGTRQKWSKPPVVAVSKRGVERRAHPGGDYSCRCQGIPVFPDDLLGVVSRPG